MMSVISGDELLDVVEGLYIGRLENTIHCKTPRHFLLHKIICEYLFELVIII